MPTSQHQKNAKKKPAKLKSIHPMDPQKARTPWQWILLLLNCLALSIGTTAGPLLMRFYFRHGGQRRWFSAWLETGGWPILIIPLSISYLKNPNKENHITPRLFIASCALGVLTGLDDYLYAWGVSYLPVSTSALLIATQLGFNAFFAFLIVRQKFNPTSINSVILLTLCSVMLAFHTNGDRPEGVTRGQYTLGFVMTLAAAALYGLILPLIEFVYKKTKDTKITYTVVMEMQAVMSFAATVVCTVGMVVNRDFQAISREAKTSDVGEVKYYVGVVCNAISWQLFYIGIFGVISLSTSLLSGILIAVYIPVTELLGVLIFKEKFSGEKGMALAMALWGFASYSYGEYTDLKTHRNNENGQDINHP